MADIKKTFKLFLLTALLLTGSLASAQRQSPVVLLNKVIATMPLIKKGPATDVASRFNAITSPQEKERLLAPVLQRLEGSRFSKTKLDQAISSVAEQANKRAEEIIAAKEHKRSGGSDAEDAQALLVDRAPYLKGENEANLRGIYEELQKNSKVSEAEARRRAQNIKYDVEYLLRNLPQKEDFGQVEAFSVTQLPENQAAFIKSAQEIPMMIFLDREVNGDDRFTDEAIALESLIGNAIKIYPQVGLPTATTKAIIARSKMLLQNYLVAVRKDKKLKPEEKAARKDSARDHTERMLGFAEEELRKGPKERRSEVIRAEVENLLRDLPNKKNIEKPEEDSSASAEDQGDEPELAGAEDRRTTQSDEAHTAFTKSALEIVSLIKTDNVINKSGQFTAEASSFKKFIEEEIALYSQTGPQPGYLKEILARRNKIVLRYLDAINANKSLNPKETTARKQRLLELSTAMQLALEDL